MTALRFLRSMDEEKFKLALRNSSFITPSELATLGKQYGADDNGMISIADVARMERDHPEYSRDTGAAILQMVHDHPEGMRLLNQIEFAADGRFCDWAWVIDLDRRTFEGYSGLSAEPITEQDRFCFLKKLENDGYSRVRKVAEWSIDDLPSNEELLTAFK